MSRIASGFRTPGGLLLAAVLVFVTVACGSNKLKSGKEKDEAMRAGRTPQSMPAADEDYFRDMDGGMGAHREEVKGRNMWIVWTGGNDRFWDAISANQFRHARLPQDGVLAPDDDRTIRPRQPFDVPRARQRAVLQESDRPRSRALRPVARRPRSVVPPRSVRERGEIPGHRGRRARQDRPGRVVLRRADGNCRGCACFRIPRSTRTRARNGIRALLPRPELLRVATISSSRTASACRAGSATSARIRSGRPPIPRTRGGRTSRRVSARSISGSIASSTGRGTRTRRASSSSCSTRHGPDRSILRSFRPTTSTTRGR